MSFFVWLQKKTSFVKVSGNSFDFNGAWLWFNSNQQIFLFQKSQILSFAIYYYIFCFGSIHKNTVGKEMFYNKMIIIYCINDCRVILLSLKIHQLDIIGHIGVYSWSDTFHCVFYAVYACTKGLHTACGILNKSSWVCITKFCVGFTCCQSGLFLSQRLHWNKVPSNIRSQRVHSTSHLRCGVTRGGPVRFSYHLVHKIPRKFEFLSP